VTASIATTRPGLAGQVRAELGYAKRPPPRTQSDGYARETELSKLIRYGCMFELEMNQMEELRLMRAENRQLRRDLQKGSEDSSAGAQLTMFTAVASANALVSDSRHTITRHSC
jgi:hypothetical protein